LICSRNGSPCSRPSGASLEYYRRGQSPDGAVIRIRRSVAEANFLFESDITTFIEEIDKHALRPLAREGEGLGHAFGDEKVRLADEWGKEMMWLTEQLPALKAKFAPYLKFAVWRRGFFSIGS